MVLEDPTLVFYFGVSIDPDRRREEHGKFTSPTYGFNYMRILAKMPNTASAGRLEYFVLRFFSEMAGNVHLKNHKAGDDYRPPNDAPSSLYVLVYENARGPNDPDPMPGRDFADNLYFAKKYKQKLPVYPKIDVNIVKEAVKFADVLRYLGYDVKPSKEDLVKTRNQQFKCTDCDASYDEIYKLKEHIRIVHEIRFVCEYDDCDYASGSASNFRRHMRDVHNVDWHAPKKQKMESYPCGIGDCQEEFETSQKAATHRKKHTRHMPKQEKETTDYYCGICKRYFTSTAGLKVHYKTQMHQANLNKEE
ncbi:hypothetical protein PVAND_017614 [Polypedilum vanderplanki]|uniref:C2H2-type domain-containing protein n=1 Tax=Polypedilum vanderplanki TaxID=319348 RepID=A0A9J6B9B7_POLVA|nr:hypothetical protein PVAND_017614 [Polypedilum vanderplanki]